MVLVARTVKLDIPATVGVPLRTPFVVRLRPFGTVPDPDTNVHTQLAPHPVAVKVVE